jgi:hypothetical protein
VGDSLLTDISGAGSSLLTADTFGAAEPGIWTSIDKLLSLDSAGVSEAGNARDNIRAAELKMRNASIAKAKRLIVS